MLYKININGVNDNIYFDSIDNWIYFLNEVHFTFGFNVLNPYKYNSDDYNMFNYYIIEILKLYDDNKRNVFENHIKNMIKNNNFIGLFNSVNFTIVKTNLNLKDYPLVY